MSNKIRVIFNRRKTATSTKTAAVEFVVCIERQRFNYSTGIFVNINQWKKDKVVRHPDADRYNVEIKNRVTQFEKIFVAMEVNGDEMTIDSFKTYIGQDKADRRSVLVWMKQRIEKRKLAEGTRKGHIVVLNALKRFGKFRTFDDVTLSHIYAFDIFIREEEVFTSTGKPIVRSQASIHNYHKVFKTYVTEAFRLGYIKENPYDRFKDKRGENKNFKHLTKDQVERLIQMRENSTDVVANCYMDFFLFQTFTGLAYTDASEFDYNKHVVTIDGHSYIDGKRIKTGQEYITPILPYTQKILERNNFELHIASNQKYNQFLKGIGVSLGCSFPLTSHVARHTFASTVSLGQGVPKEVVQVMMGHASIKTTELYAKLPVEFISNNLDEKLFKIWV